jgi:hypothetical protein
MNERADQLPEIKTRRAAVTKLPWEPDNDWGTNSLYDADGDWIGEVFPDGNRDFVLHAPADIDWLVGEVEALRARSRP